MSFSFALLILRGYNCYINVSSASGGCSEGGGGGGESVSGGCNCGGGEDEVRGCKVLAFERFADGRFTSSRVIGISIAASSSELSIKNSIFFVCVGVCLLYHFSL